MMVMMSTQMDAGGGRVRVHVDEGLTPNRLGASTRQAPCGSQGRPSRMACALVNAPAYTSDDASTVVFFSHFQSPKTGPGVQEHVCH